MWEILQYSFFRNAVVGVLIISIAAAIIGTYIVTRRLVSIGGGITHACFGGLGLGYYLGVSPIASAAVFAVGASLGVGWLVRRHHLREDSAIAVIWALGMALGVFFVFITPGYVPELNAFLFGNVLTITAADLWMFAAFTLVLVAFVTLFYHQIVACAFDRDFASVINLRVRFITLSMTVLTAVCIVLTIRLVGVMLLMSMLAMPQIIAEVFCRRFRTMMLCSIAVSILCCLTGLALSAVIDTPCSALIVMVMVSAYILARLIKWAARRSRVSAPAIIMIACVSMLPASCSLKKNTAASRNYAAFITRYNIHFNGDEHYRETLKEMESKYEDDYSRTVLMHPAEAYADPKAPQPAGDFKRSIEKAQKAIQIRSIKKRPDRKPGKGSDPEYKKWLQREEYNPFLHNSWMMMARSQYMGGDFLGAASTFYYISRHFSWLPKTVTEAKIWQARCYCAIDWLFEAENIISKIKPEEFEGDRTLEELYYFTYADLYVRSHEYQKAIPLLQRAISYAKGSQKTRLTFLLGQLYADLGDREMAYAAFKKVGNTTGASYRTRFNARIKQSEVFQGSDIRSEVKSLEAMARYGANKAYLDQIYYAIGNLYMSRGDTVQALQNYELAAQKSTRNGIDKALAQVASGRIYYDRGDYEKAQPCLAEAVPQLPETFPGYRLLKRRSDVLDELALYAQNVTLQDSLLKLSMLSPEEQRAVADRLVNELKERERREAEELAREQYLADQAAGGTGLQQGTASSAPTTFALNNDKSWYFYNEAIRNAGRTEFQKRWGSRRLEDDWRRRNKATYSFGVEDDDHTEPGAGGDDLADGADGQESDETSADREAREHASDPHFPEYYLSQIPANDQERATARDIIQEGLYNMGVILKDKLDDVEGSRRQFDRLMTEYPDNIYRLDAYFNMYLMFARRGDMVQANRYRDLIIAEFPESRQAEALANPDYLDKLRRMPIEEQSLYDMAYAAYIDNNNAEVHRLYETMRHDFPMSRVMPKMMFIEALSYVTEKDPDKFLETLTQLLSQYPETDISPLASSYVKLLGEGRGLASSAGNVRGIVWSTRLTNDSTASTVSLTEPANFDFDSDGKQLLVLIYRADLVNANQLLFEIARHNFATYNVRDYELEQMRFGQIGLLVISGFNNRSEVAEYRSQLEKGGEFRLPQGVVPLNISADNFRILLDEGRSLEEYFDAVGDKRLDQIHQAIAAPAAGPSAPAPESTPSSPRNPRPDAPDNPNSPDIPDTPLTPAQEPDPEPFDYDIPIPMLPTSKPPVPGHS